MVIKKIELTDKAQKEVDRILNNEYYVSDLHRETQKQKTLLKYYGQCAKCGSPATKLYIIKITGAELASRYCDEHIIGE